MGANVSHPGVLSSPFAADILGRLVRSLWAVVLVTGLAAAAALLTVPRLAPEILQWIPMIVWPAVLILCVVLTRSRLFFVSLLTALAWLVHSGRVLTDATVALGGGLAAHTALLYALGLLALTLTAGRGIVSEPALLPWTVVLVLLAAAFLTGGPSPPPWLPALANTLEEPELLPLSLDFSVTDSVHLLVILALVATAVVRNRLTAGLPPALLAAGYLSANPQLPFQADIAWITAPLLAAVAILAEAYSLAYIDTLTGLPGRRALEEHERQVGRRYAVAMVDIDHFKGFNDTHGHDAGDNVLRMVAARLSSVSAGGKAFRYGGEEFTIVFRHADEERIAAELERLRGAIEATPFTIRASARGAGQATRGNAARGAAKPGRRGRGRGGGATSVRVTVSIGLAVRRAEDRGVEGTRGRADQALYRAKKQGRNRVVRAA